MDYTTIYAVLTTIGTVAYGYLYYRRAEVLDLAMEIVDAYTDKAVTEEEYGKIVEKLKIVLYKK